MATLVVSVRYLGGDPGLIYRRDLSGGSWTLVYTAPSGSAVFGLCNGKNAPGTIAGVLTDGTTYQIIVSFDGGVTWATTGSPVTITPPAGAPKIRLSEDGTLLYGVDVLGVSGDGLFVSSDYGATWDLLQAAVGDAGSGFGAVHASSGLIWWLQFQAGDSAAILNRIAANGSGFTQVTLPALDSGGRTPTELFRGFDATDTMLSHARTTPECQVVTDLAGAMTVTTLTDASADHADDAISIAPITDSVFIGWLFDDGDFLFDIVRSTDGGATWTQVFQTLDVSGNLDPQAVAVPGDPSHVYLAMDVPNVYASADGGATWTTDPTPAPTSGLPQWTSIVAIGATVHPGLARYRRADGALLYFRGTFEL